MSRTRQLVDDAINGDSESVEAATLRALRAPATAVDDIDSRITSIQNRMLTMALSVGGSVLAGLILFVATK